MLKPYDLLEGVLNEIEKRLENNISENLLAEKVYTSKVHLRRLFKFAFGQTIGAYIRSRKLAASIEDLLLTDMNVLDIALKYGLEYEQSYIRAFKREFGLTPGDLRRTGQIIKIMPPLQLFDSNKFGEGLVFGPEIVIIPQFHAVGKRYKLPFRDALVVSKEYRAQFDRELINIPNTVNNNVYININSEAETSADYSWFTPSVQVKTLDNIPEGFCHYTFPTSLCARFRFIGIIGDDINMATADGMFDAIDDFMADDQQKFFLERKRLNIDRYSSAAYDGCLYEWEWFAPVIRKTKSNIPVNPDGIIKTYKQKIPALRFIGKKYSETLDDSVFDCMLSTEGTGTNTLPKQLANKILADLDNWRLNYLFDVIEKKSDKNLKTLYEGGDAYISLIRKKDDKVVEYWLGMFMPEKTEVPEGYDMIDFPKSTLGVCLVYGKRNSIIHYDADCRTKLTKEGICSTDNMGTKWFFQRFNWHRFFEEDRYGKRLLEYCYF
ncbi:MAG: helix-turn-helix domain-containing protein [Treponema sp.]|nr:helix-turn-helix domain-containing protein [Treponema sp.]